MNEKCTNLLAVYRQLPESFEGWPQSVNDRAPHGDFPLNIAAQRGSIEEVEVLENNGADINQAGEHGYLPLHDAVERGHLELVKYLIDKGARIEALSDDRTSALELANIFGFEDIADLLEGN